MVTARTRRKFTYEDYRNTPDGIRYELLDGELVVVPAPNMFHQTTSKKLFWKFEPLEERGLGLVFHPPTDVVFSDTDTVQPDIVFISAERAHIITEQNIRGAPDLVIEILSPSTAGRDRTFKRTLYERHGVKEYWMVDADAKSITLLILGEDGYELAGIYGEGQTLTSPTLPGFRLNLDDIF